MVIKREGRAPQNNPDLGLGALQGAIPVSRYFLTRRVHFSGHYLSLTTTFLWLLLFSGH
jgi:hypothetical protein